jgi:flagellar protein FlgJ
MISGIEGLIEQSANHALADGRVEAIKKTIEEGKIKKASEEFEAYFISYMLKVMRETVPKGLLTQNRMGEAFQSFYDEAIGKQSAQVGGIGLAQYIETKLREDEVILSREDKVASQ